MKEYYEGLENRIEELEDRKRNCPQMVNRGIQDVSFDDYKYFLVGNVYKIIFIMLNV